ncbi:MAG: phosphoribosylpyrophosphate synthetase [Bacteroidota bacterium]|nr:phosphoribosylpyrophosphate synthetase [Bacteroidota bacterium]
MFTYDTLSQAINGLKDRGYKLDFNLNFDCLECVNDHTRVQPEEFNVTEIHRFEGNTNPDDSSILYAIEVSDGRKGVLVDAYGAYSGQISEEMMHRLQERR